MSKTSETTSPSRLKVVVSDDDATNDVPDNIDPDLYVEPEREDSRVEFDLEPDDELVEVLRDHGYDINFE